jgi:hypothetical protein
MTYQVYIEEFLSNGKLKDALEEARKISNDAVLLYARYCNNERFWKSGMIEFNEWNIIQGQIKTHLLNVMEENPGIFDIERKI